MMYNTLQTHCNWWMISKKCYRQTNLIWGIGINKTNLLRRSKTKMLPPTIKRRNTYVLLWGSFCYSWTGDLQKVEGTIRKKKQSPHVAGNAVASALKANSVTVLCLCMKLTTLKYVGFNSFFCQEKCSYTHQSLSWTQFTWVGLQCAICHTTYPLKLLNLWDIWDHYKILC